MQSVTHIIAGHFDSGQQLQLVPQVHHFVEYLQVFVDNHYCFSFKNQWEYIYNPIRLNPNLLVCLNTTDIIGFQFKDSGRCVDIYFNANFKLSRGINLVFEAEDKKAVGIWKNIYNNN